MKLITALLFVCSVGAAAQTVNPGGGGGGGGANFPSTLANSPCLVEVTTTSASSSVCASAADIQSASTDATKNSSAIFKIASGGVDTGVPTPTAGQDIFAYTGGALQISKNGSAYTPAGDVTGGPALNTRYGQPYVDSTIGKLAMLAPCSAAATTYIVAQQVTTAGTAVAPICIQHVSTNLTDSANLARLNQANTFTQPQTAPSYTTNGSGNGYVGLGSGGTNDFFIQRTAAGAASFGSTNGGTNGILSLAQIIPTGSAPTIANGPGAGTSPGTPTITGNNRRGVITVITGTATTTNATLATITFNGTLGTAPLGCLLQPRNSGGASNYGVIYTTSPSTTAWTVSTGSTAPAISTPMSWGYLCE